MVAQTLSTSPKLYARIAGLLYLINIAFGFFAVGYVPAVISGSNAEITMQNILSHETLYRLSLAAHIIILLTNVPLAVIFWKLFKVVNKNAALVVVFFTLMGTAIEAANLLNDFAPLLLLKNNYMSSFTPQQVQSTINMVEKLSGIGFELALVFFGFYGITIGYLILRSTFLPRLIGAFMIIGGSCYVFNSFADFLSPKFAALLFPYIQLPSGLAELTLCLWMLIAGVNVSKWREKANEV